MSDARIEEAVRTTGISLEKLTQAARMLANSITPVILFGKGITAQRDECLVEELYKLAVLVGAVDQERDGLLSVKGQTNSTHRCPARSGPGLRAERTESGLCGCWR